MVDLEKSNAQPYRIIGATLIKHGRHWAAAKITIENNVVKSIAIGDASDKRDAIENLKQLNFYEYFDSERSVPYTLPENIGCEVKKLDLRNYERN